MIKGTKRFSNPQALSSALAALGTLQPQAFGLLNRLVPLVLASNYYAGSYGNMILIMANITIPDLIIIASLFIGIIYLYITNGYIWLNIKATVTIVTA